MGRKSGDKSRYQRQRRKKLARRAEMRAHFGKAPRKPGAKQAPAEAAREAATD